MAENQESLWVLRAQAGDREALELLLGALMPPLRGYLRRICPAHADDALQDVLLTVVRKLAYLRDPELVRPWTYRIASREAMRHVRRERRAGSAGLPEAEIAADATLPDDDRTLLAEEAIALLDDVPPASRAALVLHYLHELTFGEVASILEVPVGTVKSRINYGLGLLRRALPKAGGAP